MSSSLKVVSMAQVFCASLSLCAIRSRIRFIFTRRSPREGPAPRTTGSGAVKSAVFWAEIGAEGIGAAAGASVGTAFGAEAIGCPWENQVKKLDHFISKVTFSCGYFFLENGEIAQI